MFPFLQQKEDDSRRLSHSQSTAPSPKPPELCNVRCFGGCVCAGSSLPVLALIAVTQRATSSPGWARAGSPAESELLSESKSPSQVLAAPLCPVGWVCDYRTGVSSEGLKTCAQGYPGQALAQVSLDPSTLPCIVYHGQNRTDTASTSGMGCAHGDFAAKSTQGPFQGSGERTVSIVTQVCSQDWSAE